MASIPQTSYLDSQSLPQPQPKPQQINNQQLLNQTILQAHQNSMDLNNSVIVGDKIIDKDQFRHHYRATYMNCSVHIDKNSKSLVYMINEEVEGEDQCGNTILTQDLRKQIGMFGDQGLVGGQKSVWGQTNTTTNTTTIENKKPTSKKQHSQTQDQSMQIDNSIFQDETNLTMNNRMVEQLLKEQKNPYLLKIDDYDDNIPPEQNYQYCCFSSFYTMYQALKNNPNINNNQIAKQIAKQIFCGQCGCVRKTPPFYGLQIFRYKEKRKFIRYRDKDESMVNHANNSYFSNNNCSSMSSENQSFSGYRANNGQYENNRKYNNKGNNMNQVKGNNHERDYQNNSRNDKSNYNNNSSSNNNSNSSNRNGYTKKKYNNNHNRNNNYYESYRNYNRNYGFYNYHNQYPYNNYYYYQNNQYTDFSQYYFDQYNSMNNSDCLTITDTTHNHNHYSNTNTNANTNNTIINTITDTNNSQSTTKSPFNKTITYTQKQDPYNHINNNNNQQTNYKDNSTCQVKYIEKSMMKKKNQSCVAVRYVEKKGDDGGKDQRFQEVKQREEKQINCQEENKLNGELQPSKQPEPSKKKQKQQQLQQQKQQQKPKQQQESKQQQPKQQEPTQQQSKQQQSLSKQQQPLPQQPSHHSQQSSFKNISQFQPSSENPINKQFIYQKYNEQNSYLTTNKSKLDGDILKDINQSSEILYDDQINDLNHDYFQRIREEQQEEKSERREGRREGQKGRREGRREGREREIVEVKGVKLKDVVGKQNGMCVEREEQEMLREDIQENIEQNQQMNNFQQPKKPELPPLKKLSLHISLQNIKRFSVLEISTQLWVPPIEQDNNSIDSSSYTQNNNNNSNNQTIQQQFYYPPQPKQLTIDRNSTLLHHDKQLPQKYAKHLQIINRTFKKPSNENPDKNQQYYVWEFVRARYHVDLEEVKMYCVCEKPFKCKSEKHDKSSLQRICRACHRSLKIRIVGEEFVEEEGEGEEEEEEEEEEKEGGDEENDY